MLVIFNFSTDFLKSFEKYTPEKKCNSHCGYKEDANKRIKKTIIKKIKYVLMLIKKEKSCIRY